MKSIKYKKTSRTLFINLLIIVIAGLSFSLIPSMQVTAGGGTRLGLCWSIINDSPADDPNRDTRYSLCMQNLDAGAMAYCADSGISSGPALEECKREYFVGNPDGSDDSPSGGDVNYEQLAQEKAAQLVEKADCKIDMSSGNCRIVKRIVDLINALSAAVGIVVVIMIVWGGIKYTSSRDNPQQAAQAKEHIRNALIALVFYIFMMAFLNWLVPGGVL